MNKNCLFCNKVIVVKPKEFERKKFCSKECKYSSLRRKIIFCTQCNESFKPSKRQKFCSHKCYTDSLVGISHNWGSKISKSLKGKPKSAEHIKHVVEKNIGQVRTKIRDENHFSWKGDLVGYDALHGWVAKRKPRPLFCQKCNKKDIKILCSNSIIRSSLQLANISGEYKRDLSDWIYLCVLCHVKLDKGRFSIRKIFKGGRKPPNGMI